LTDEQHRQERNQGPGAAAHGVILSALFVLALSAASSARGQGIADSGPGFADALLAGRPILELRPRYNRIEESDKEDVTRGWTYRAVVGWRTAPWMGLRFTAEGINTGHIGPKEYNDDGAQFATSEYPLLPDPGHTGLNQAHVEYTGIDNLRVRVGRQRVRMDNQRWISDNDFRQTPQLFDGVEVANTSLPDTELLVSYFNRQRDTSGETNDLKLTIVHAAWSPVPGHSFAAYGYFHDQPVNGAFTGFSNNSYRAVGVRGEGAFPFGEFEIPYTVEYAQQRPYAGGNALIDVDYWRAGAGLAWRDVTLRYDEEVKGSNNGRYGLQMPLTDFYSFNGWTLHFFNTPFRGLHDKWLTLRAGYAPANLVLYAESHKFRSDLGDLDFGKETDVGLFWTFWEGAQLRLQHAAYDSGSGQVAPRIRKTWITLSYSY
jgi:hypothetical protein